ncbi:MAG: phosphotransferase [Allobranchiibius sp.]
MNQSSPIDAPDATEFSQVATRPTWFDGDVRAAVAQLWGLELSAIEPLVSERDQNWDVRTNAGDRFVFKVANSADSLADIEFQQSMMARMAAVRVPAPQPLPTASGQTLAVHRGHIVWLIDFMPGVVLARLEHPPTELFTEIGRTIAQLTAALDSFDHPAAHRWLQWDVQHAPQVLSTYLPYVIEGDRRTAIERALRTFHERVTPRLADLEFGVIHNDVNDHNLLVCGTCVTGVIDFGDAVHSLRINELAVTCAYAMLNRTEPLAVLAAITEGYESSRLLTSLERELLPDLIMSRLATSVSISAYQASRDGADDYLRVSEAPAWKLIHQLNGAPR